MWLMKKRPGERELQPNPLITLFPEVRGWIREDDRIRTLGIYIALALLTFLLYLPSAWHDFIALADYEYVRDNPHVATGLTWPNFLWAFRTGHTGLWQPLTWISHMRDCQFSGITPGLQHINNVLLHTANVLLLFIVLNWFTGARWRSAFVAAVFAVHPLNVESVAWIAERKDLLATFFFLLTLLAYGQYLERRGTGPYLLMLFVFALGLMTSPIIVTLPVVLFLIDYWPLGYLEMGVGFRRILYEKIPLFALSAVACVTTFFVHEKAAALSIFDIVPRVTRLESALLSSARYLGKIFWPANLAIPYRYDQAVSTVALLAVAVLLIGITVGVLYFRRTKQYLVTGWFWILVTLVPTIGFVQIGAQSMADRYTYIPSIGIFIGITWAGADLFSHWRVPQRAIATLTAGLILACVIKTSFQLTYWADTETLLTHSVKINPKNYLALEALADEFQRQKRTNEQVACLNRALQIAPERPFKRADVALLLSLSKRPKAAAAQYKIALKSISPSVQKMGPTERSRASDVANNLAWIRATALNPELRDSAEALELSKRSVEWSGGRADAVQLDTIGAAQAQAGQFDAAIATARKAADMAKTQQQSQLLGEIERHISLYEMGQPFRDFSQ